MLAFFYSDQRFSCCRTDDAWSPGYPGLQVKPLRWSTRPALRFSAPGLMDLLSGQRLVFVSKSIGRQVAAGLLCGMEAAGYTVNSTDGFAEDDPLGGIQDHHHIARVHDADGAFFDVSILHSGIVKMRAVGQLLHRLHARDFVVANFGAHYMLRKHVELVNHTDAMAPLLAEFRGRGGTVALMDTFPTHFPTSDHSGIIESYSRKCFSSRPTPGCGCQPVAPDYFQQQPYHVTEVAKRAAKTHNFPFVPLLDTLIGREDAHLERRLKHTCNTAGVCTAPAAKFVDCRHLCMRPSLFDPIVGRLQAVLKSWRKPGGGSDVPQC